MAAAVQLVRPAGARHEALALALIATAMIFGLAWYVREQGRGNTTDALHDWQVSAFNTLTGADQAIYNALYTAKDDVPYLYDDINLMNGPGVKFRWPNLEDFQQALLPPFYKDKSWEQNGSLEWSLHEPLAEGEMQGSTLYLGTNGRLPQQGSFLLVIGHVHAGFQNNNAIVIWWNPESRVVMPQSGFQDRLILQGWRQVVPYSGAQEVRRIFGADDSASLEEDQESADQTIDGLFGE